MTLRQLEYLVALAETRSFTRAAERALVSQPSFSRQIRALEASVGAELVDRLRAPVALTTVGEAVLVHARATLDAASAAAAAARAVSRLELGDLRLATITSAALGVLPEALGAWHRAHPGLRVELVEQPSGAALEAVMRRGRADVAVGPPPEGFDGEVAALGEEELAVVLPRGDPLLGEDDAVGAPVALAALADRAWVLYHRDSGLAPVVERACAAAGFAPRAAARVRHTSPAAQLAAAGLGPALVPANVVPPDLAGLARRVEPAVRRPLAAYTRPAPSPAAAALVRVLVERSAL